MKIKDFVHGEFKSYVNYDNQRNIPNLIDGLKWSQRKVLYAFINHIGTQKIVCDKAGMRAADVSHFAHGANSMIGVLIGMAQSYPGSNNMPLLTGHGQFGTRQDHEASSERYISVQLNDNYKKLFDADDEHILLQGYSHGHQVEPVHYLPKLPLLLINGSSGTGNGFAATVLPYNVADIKVAVQEVLKHGYVKTPLTPWLKGYTGTIVKDRVSNQVTFTGKIEVKNTTTLVITELPPNMDLETYERVLRDLIEKKFIKDYDNESKEKYWRFVIDVPRTTSALPIATLLDKFKLIGRETETLAVWVPGAAGMEIRIFETVEDLVAVWVDARLQWYEKRRLNLVQRYDAEADWLKSKRKFILWWNEDAANLVKLKTSQLKEMMYAEVTQNLDYVTRLLAMRITSLGIDEVTELEDEIGEAVEMSLYYQNVGNKDMMTTEVKSLKI
jgi:DNA topoisomerase-2